VPIDQALTSVFGYLVFGGEKRPGEPRVFAQRLGKFVCISVVILEQRVQSLDGDFRAGQLGGEHRHTKPIRRPHRHLIELRQ